MWKKVLIYQTCICLFIFAVFFILTRQEGVVSLGKKNIPVYAITRHYTVSDLVGKSKTTIKNLVKTPAVITGYIISSQEVQKLAEPIDMVENGEYTCVYAVSGGQVMDTGENHALGKYVKIRHDGMISVYGNCSKIYVKEGKHVRRGHVIASYKQNEENAFYYDLIEE